MFFLLNKKSIFTCCVATSLLSSLCHATSVLALRTDEALFVGADSKVVAINGSETGFGCKVSVSQNYVFSSAGLLKDTRGPFDLHKIVEDSIAANSNFNNVLTTYQNKMLEMLPPALKFLMADVPAYYEKFLRRKHVVESIFGAVEDNVVHLAYRGFVPDDPERVDIVKNDCPGTCSSPLMLLELGEKGAIDRELDANPQIWKQIGIPNALERLIRLQAVASPEYVSLPAAIVMLPRNGTVQWLSTGMCGARNIDQPHGNQSGRHN